MQLTGKTKTNNNRLCYTFEVIQNVSRGEGPQGVAVGEKEGGNSPAHESDFPF